MSASKLITLVRRELWETRSLVWVPLATVLLILIGAVLSSTLSGGVQVNIDGDDSIFWDALASDPVRQSQFFAVWISALLIPVLLVATIVVFFYLADSLYSERKDRSVLFWKSLPVSDLSTVGSKVFTALVAVPLWTWLLSLLLGLGVFGVIALRYSGTALDPVTDFHFGVWLAAQGRLLLNLAIASMWYAPIAGYLLIVSVLARRAPALWIGLPPLALAFAEKAVFDTGHVLEYLGYRLSAFFQAFDPSLDRPREGGVDQAMRTIEYAYGHLSAARLLTEPQLWLGVLVAAALIWLAARLRRWHDDG